MNVIFNAISLEEFRKISDVEVAHTALNILQTMHEGTKPVKINKLQQLTSRIESIKMAEYETFDDFCTKLNDIVNSTFNLVEVYEEPKIVRKILRFLTEEFMPQVTAIIESKDVDTILVDELVGSLQTYEYDLPKTSKSKSMALKSIDDVDENVFDYEISSIENAYLAKQFRNFLKKNNKMVRNKNFADHKNVKKNEQPKGNPSEKLNFNKDKVGQSSSNSLGQQFFGCQGYGHVKAKCPTYLRSKGKAITVTLNDDEGSDYESDSDQEGTFMTFTTTIVVDESIE